MSYWVIERRLRNGAMVALGTPGVGEELIGAVTDADERYEGHPATIWRFHDKETAEHMIEMFLDRLPEGDEFWPYDWRLAGEGQPYAWGAVEVKEDL